MPRAVVTALLWGVLISGAEAAKAAARRQPEEPAAQWIWSDLDDPAPRNRFTWFRRVVQLDEIPSDATLRFAADSNARFAVNGEWLRRKMTRFDEPHIRAEVIDVRGHLRRGANVVVVLHHNWGDITCFQRTANRHAGLWVSSEWLQSDETWRWLNAPAFVPHIDQIVGVTGDHRIRFPMVADGRRSIASPVHGTTFDDSSWACAEIVTDGPWPDVPPDVETPGQREGCVRPGRVLAAGTAERIGPLPVQPLMIAEGIRSTRCTPHPRLTAAARQLRAGRPIVISADTGESRYITFDFGRPVHGYPFLELADASDGVLIDFGYAELPYRQYDGRRQVTADGWIDPELVVGHGYADRYITRAGAQSFGFPDERTARWLALHVHFPDGGQITLEDLGFIESQYPVTVRGSFACGDDRVDQIVRLGLTHARLTMTDAYVDTPGREDGQWYEDARQRALIAASWFGDIRLRALLLRTVAESQTDDGDFHPFPPSNYPVRCCPYDWSVQWVAVLHDQYLWTGDRAVVRKYWPTLVRYWQHALEPLHDDGLWQTRYVFADIRVGRRLRSDDQSSGIVTPWIIERLDWSAEMADAIGEADQAAAWRETRARMIRAFRAHHVVRTGHGLPPHVADLWDPTSTREQRGYSQAGQTVAIYTDLLTPEEAAADLAYAFPPPDGSPPPGVTRWNNPTYGYRALRALAHVGRTKTAVAHLIERYEPYLPGHPRNSVPTVLQGESGGPLPEYWISREDVGLDTGEINPAQPRDETGSHGWNAWALLGLHDTLLGVRIIEPGGGALRIAPDDAGLPFVEGCCVTPRGHVSVAWRPAERQLAVELPANTQAELVYPSMLTTASPRIEAGAGMVSTRHARSLLLRGPGRCVVVGATPGR